MTILGKLVLIAFGALLACFDQLPLAPLRQSLMQRGRGAFTDLLIALWAILFGVLSGAFFFHAGSAREASDGSCPARVCDLNWDPIMKNYD